jgi:hypothetical protein
MIDVSSFKQALEDERIIEATSDAIQTHASEESMPHTEGSTSVKDFAVEFGSNGDDSVC